jgi:mono/diheme cytochrome c family protein
VKVTDGEDPRHGAQSTPNESGDLAARLSNQTLAGGSARVDTSPLETRGGTMYRQLILAAAFSLLISGSAWAEAADLFKAKCSSCHGEDGKAHTKIGQKEKVDDFTTEKFQAGVTDEKILGIITNGVPDTKMKAFSSKLTAEEIASLAKYVRTFKGK